MSGSRDLRTVSKNVPPTSARVVLLAVLLLVGMASPIPASAQSGKPKNPLQVVQDRHRDRFREFTNQINKLAQFCDEKQLDDAAAQVRSRLINPESEAVRVERLPTEVRAEIPASVTGDERAWRTQLRHIEVDYAKDLHLQARAALRQGYASYAYNLIREASLHDPDHKQVRRILGFVRSENQWITPFAYEQKQKQFVWNNSFGWLPKSYEARYLAGERNLNGRWMTVEKEKDQRRDFKSAWEVRTDHYLIKTNVSLERGVELGKALEDFHAVFYETFAAFYHTPEQLQKLFDDSAKVSRSDAPHKVHFYRTRDEYLEGLRKFFPSIDQTNGVYMTSDRVAHFYYDPDHDNEGTLFHEATHQLFFESHQANRTISDNHHFWIIEGIACYMESFRRKGESFSLGDPNYIRFAGARNNLLNKHYYVPLREFSGYGMQEFQGSSELAKNYTQASGLARFFMHYDKGRYREALVQHLSQLYSNDSRIRDRADSLDKLTGVDFEDLDRQYAEDARETENQAALR